MNDLFAMGDPPSPPAPGTPQPRRPPGRVLASGRFYSRELKPRPSRVWATVIDTPADLAIFYVGELAESKGRAW